MITSQKASLSFREVGHHACGVISVIPRQWFDFAHHPELVVRQAHHPELGRRVEGAE